MKEERTAGNVSFEYLENRGFRKKNIKLMVIGVVSFFVILSIVIFIGLSAHNYFQSPLRKINLGAEIERVLISEDGGELYIKLKAGTNEKEIKSVKFILRDKDGVEHFYETSEGISEISFPFKKSFWNIFKKPKYEGAYDYEYKRSTFYSF